MAHLLHIDSSVQGDQSVSRRLTAAAAQRWRAEHPDGTIRYRDFVADPIPHFNPAQQATAALSAELIEEVRTADTILLGLPLYNFGPPSTVKAWVDHLFVPGLSMDPDTGEGLLGDTEFIVLAARGGGYGPGTPRHGWDHAESWLPHGVSMIGLQPRFITAELTRAATKPALAEFKPLAAESLSQALTAIDQLWRTVEKTA